MHRHRNPRCTLLLAAALISWQVAGCGGGDQAETALVTDDAPVAQPSPPAGPSQADAPREVPSETRASKADTDAPAAAPSSVGEAATPTEEQPDTEPAPSETPAVVDETPREPATVEEVVRLLDLRTLPLLEGAKTRGAREQIGQLFCEVKGSAVDVFNFHRDQLVERGWKPLPDGGETGPSPALTFKQQGFVVYLSVSEIPGPNNEGGWSRVTISNYGNVDTAKLPVPEGAQLFYALPIQTAYLTEVKVPQTAEACRKLLTEQGWEPFGSNAVNPESQTLEFKRNAIHLLAWISVAPAQGGKTLISYNTDVMSVELPAPPDARDLSYVDAQTMLSFAYAPEKAEELAAFYRDALGPKGWKAISESVDGDAGSAAVVFRNSQGDLITLGMEVRGNAARVSVNHSSAAAVAALEAQRQAEARPDAPQPEKPGDAPKFAVPVPASAKGVEQDDPEELTITVAAGTGKAALESIRERFKSAGWKEESATVEDQAGSVVFAKDDLQVLVNFFDIGFGEDAEVSLTSFGIALEPARDVAAANRSDADAPADPAQPARGILAERFPIPEGAVDVERNAGIALITYRSELDVMKIAEFYRKEMQELGWKEDKEDTLLEADLPVGRISFAKGEDSLRIAIQDGKPASRTRMVIFGEGLVWSAAPRDDSEPANADADAPAVPEGELVADDQYELPVPAGDNEAVQERNRFRVAISAKIAAELPRVLEFYRRELADRGWKEDAAKAAVTDEQAALEFTGDQVEGRLRLSRKGKDTTIELSLRYPQQAKKAGLLPEPGKARLVLGNAHEKDVVVVVGDEEHKVTAGVGAKDPKDALSLHLAPGKYKVTIKIPGEEDQSEAMQLGADETWGVIVIPSGGYFPTQLY